MNTPLSTQVAQPGPLAHPMQPPVWGAPPPLFGGVSAEQKMELLELWRSVVKRKWAIVALALGVGVIAAIVSLAMTPIYRASATVLIEAGKAKVVSVEDVYSVGQNREYYQTQVELLKSREVAVRTAKALKLWDHPEFDPRRKELGWKDRFAASIGFGDKVDTDKTWAEQDLADAVAGKLLANVSIVPVRMSQLIRVEFESSDRELAAKIANTIAAQYIENERDERFRMTTEVSQQLQQRLSTLRDKLATSERALQAYRESKGLVNVGGSAQTNSSQQLGAVTEKLLQARGKRIELESAYNQVRGLSPAAYGSLPEVIRDAGVNAAQQVVSVAGAKVAELSTRLGPEHEQLKQAQAELAQAQASLQLRQTAIVRSLTREYESARSTELALERNLNEIRGSAQGVNRDEFQLAVLDREYQSNRQLFEMFMSRSKETSLVGDVQPSMARITDLAIAPSAPVKPNRRNLVMTAMLLALLLGALASVAIDRLDNTIKGSDDAEARLQVPVLATLPLVDGSNRRTMARLFLENTHSHFSEGIRTARTGVMLSSLDSACKVLLVTSAVPGEGKTTVAVNLALALAHAGTKTLLIDADMRRGQTSRSLGQAGATRGLAAAVAGTAPLEQCLVAVKRTTLSLLPVGETPPNPLELLHSQKFKDVLDKLKSQFQVIIIDSPPLELVSEAQVLAPMATSCLLVTRAMSTPLPLARKALKRLQRAGGNVLGVVVNGLDFSRAKRYYGEYVASSYSYGYDGYAPKAGDGADVGEVDIELDAAPSTPKRDATVRGLLNRFMKSEAPEQKRA